MENLSVFTMFLMFLFIHIEGSLISTKIDMCGPITNLVLDQFDESSATITLMAHDRFTTSCNLKITAPKTHVIYLKIIDGEYQRDVFPYTGIDSCNLNVYQDGNPHAVWSADPCSNELLPDIDLLHPDVTLEWSPPIDPSRTQGKKILVTAVGRGEVCNDSMQHTCMSIGHEPLFCISKYLICDGNHNCPKGATRDDEDEKMCKVTFFMLFKQMKNTELNDKILNLIMTKSTKPPKTQVDWRDWTIIQKAEDITTIIPTTTEETHTSNIESLSTALSHYGPWGYILLGMLICGTVLMFCGVWECFKKPKPPGDALPSTPATVLIINQQDDNNPPRYEDIDPPSYATLFPNIKENDRDEEEGVATSDSQSHSDEASANVANENQNETRIVINSISATIPDNAFAASSAVISLNTDAVLTNSDITSSRISSV